ncbi:Uncharacterised protein [Vibrio cholerae]|nr:Uncharacterised protein [Vibrio cholerae]CSB73050.1 Uncharacterised protein [Vibrio cholerae]CSI32118.1 Uncharacterised protein [Vibrio cholerae]
MMLSAKPAPLKSRNSGIVMGQPSTCPIATNGLEPEVLLPGGISNVPSLAFIKAKEGRGTLASLPLNANLIVVSRCKAC